MHISCKGRPKTCIKRHVLHVQLHKQFYKYAVDLDFGAAKTNPQEIK